MINTDDGGFNPYDYEKSYEKNSLLKKEPKKKKKNGIHYNNCTINIYNSDNKGIDMLKQKLEAEEKRFDLLYNFITKNIEMAIDTFVKQKEKEQKEKKKKDEPVGEPIYSYPIGPKDEPKHKGEPKNKPEVQVQVDAQYELQCPYCQCRTTKMINHIYKKHRKLYYENGHYINGNSHKLFKERQHEKDYIDF